MAYITMFARILKLKWPYIEAFATIVKTKVIAIFAQITCVVTGVESVADIQLAENLPPNISLESKVLSSNVLLSAYYYDRIQ